MRTDATGKVTHSGVFNCGPSDPVAWQTGMNGSMFQSTGRYLQRATDFRSVMGKVIRDHLGASQEQLNRIIPATPTRTKASSPAVSRPKTRSASPASPT